MVIHSHKKTEKPEKVTSPLSEISDREAFENELRPKGFDQYVGQSDVKGNLQIFVQAALKRGQPLDHTLFYGPPGLGKTTLAMILASELKAQIRLTSGPALEKAGDLAAILTNLKAGDLLFIDEIHRLRLPVEEILYTAMEDRAIDLVIGKGPSARTMRLEIPPFTLVGATTRLSMLSGPLRDRFGHIEKLRYYEDLEIQAILERSAQILNIQIEDSAAQRLSSCARKTPRIANRLLRRMRDFAEIRHEGVITELVIEKGLKSLSIDPRGLDFADQQYLKALGEKFSGGPVGLSTMAAAISEEEETIEDVIEPFLILEGFIQKTPRGRQLTQAGWEHLEK